MSITTYVLLGFGGSMCLTFAQSKQEIIPQTYVAYKTPHPIVIDGKADDLAWKKTKWTNDFIDIEGNKTPKYQTRVKMLWDNQYYYILADIKEPHVWADIEEHDAVIFYNNDFEVFIDPDGDTHNYYELEINALNTVWDLFLTKPYREATVVLNDWKFTGLISAIEVNGTLNNPQDIDRGWTVELAIPFKDLRTSYYQNNVPKDKFWRVNFSRVNWQHEITNNRYSRKKGTDGTYVNEYNWVWSPIGVINMHLPEKWGYVYFSSKVVGTLEAFSIPKDEKIKWHLYELYRAQKQYQKEHNCFASRIKDLKISNLVIDHQKINVSMQKHDMGYNLSAKSPFSNNVLIVKEDGKFFLK
ncbi:MAG: carbohydrate-binding family 9-like protein [Flavobacteriaceae bacterium]|nr:carbohydrate-binding family 9-like protein [Flavobacteriaceae bacterium]MCY4253742.1 carbohydrate-binding family 9-like protein [Flavobacteriaceae bacterium]